MTIVITGGSGFIGTEIQKQLKESIWKDEDVLDFSLRKGYDITNHHALYNNLNPDDIVIHLAAVSRFAQADNDPYRAFNINVCGTLNVIKACIEKDVAELIVASTGSVYIPVTRVPITEHHPIRFFDKNTYGSSKIMMETILKGYSGQFPVTVLRLAHVYGAEKTWAGIYNFVQRLKRGLKPEIFGGGQSNDFISVQDVARAFIKAISYTPIGFEAFNIGTGEEINIVKAEQIIEKIMGLDIGYELTEQRDVDATRFVYDITKAKQKLRFKAKYSFESGIKLMLEQMKD